MIWRRLAHLTSAEAKREGKLGGRIEKIIFLMEGTVAGAGGTQVFLDFLVVVVVVSWRKSRRTALLHLGHLGSSPGSMTYMRQRGQPASTIDGPSGLSASDDRQELGEDVPRGESSPPVVAILLEVSPLVGNARFSFRSSFWLSPWPLRLLILLLLLLWQKQPTSSNTTTVSYRYRTPRRAAGSTNLSRRGSTRPEAEERLLWNLHHHELPMPFYRLVEGVKRVVFNTKQQTSLFPLTHCHLLSTEIKIAGFSIGDIIALH
ncbi:unnamed protein product [Musa hybrid cultivar]